MYKPSFLQIIADDLLATYGTNLSHLHIVFPGQRAKLFLNPLLSRHGETIWAPQYCDMRGLIQSLSPYQLMEPVEAVCLLHKVYAQHVEDAETIDEFYPWGNVLLSDFDDIDKHLVDTRQLFANMAAWQDMDSLDFLSQEQIDALQHFFTNFSIARHTELKERFLRLWSKMYDIYTSWHELMLTRGTMTEGAMYRHVIENDLTAQLLDDEKAIYVFAGFNVLDTVEEKLMTRLQRTGRARFYWDYDKFYVENEQSEAGLFIKKNLEKFPPPDTLPTSLFDNLLQQPKHITFIAAGGNNVQSRWVKTWVEELERPTSTSNAIVLCDETLLHPVLHAIPDQEHGGPEVANITMGYPVMQTTACTYLQLLLSLQTEGWNAERSQFLSRHKRLVQSHPMFHGEPFVHEEGSEWLLTYLRQNIIINSEDDLESETIFRLYTMLTRMIALVQEGILAVTVPTLGRILLHAVKLISVPFHGEPLRGMQVMGMLETRCLDFDNLLMLSVGEGFLPTNTQSSSFIPYHLRAPFGLTTIEHRVSVQAYYFYRLLQRAKNVTCIYNTTAVDGVKNEMSRFLRQILAETSLPIKMLSLAPELKLQRARARLEVEKTDLVMNILRQNIKHIAPTTLNTYLQCPLRFYLQKVVGIKESDTPEDGIVDGATFGTIFHDSAQTVYEMIGHKHITASDLERFIGKNGKETPQSRALLMGIVQQKFEKDYFKRLSYTDNRYTGQMLIQRDVICDYLRLLLLHDYRLAPFDILCVEEWCTAPITLTDGTIIKTGGKIDRLDLVMIDGTPTVRVVDYKSGIYNANKLHVKDFDTLFSEGGYALQTFVYALAVCNGGEQRPVVPALFYIQQGANENYNPILTFGDKKEPIADFHPLSQKMLSKLKATLEEIFDPAIPFHAAPLGSEACTWCPFTHLCER